MISLEAYKKNFHHNLNVHDVLHFIKLTLEIMENIRTGKLNLL